jgi:hypothetical protein
MDSFLGETWKEVIRVEDVPEISAMSSAWLI